MLEVSKNDALLIIDVQNDFCSGGALAVPQGELVVRIINCVMKQFAHIVFTRDWHPGDHCSFSDTPEFKDQSWPPHCVQNSPGAEFHGDLWVPVDAVVIDKGADADGEAYSAFSGTGLDALLREWGITRVFICGLALDYCVLATALDAVNAGFQTVVLNDAVRAVNPDAAPAVYERLRQAGVRVANSGRLML